MKKMLLLTYFLFLVECSNEPRELSAPTRDLSTPDNALRSWINFAVWKDTTNKADTSFFPFYAQSTKSRMRRSFDEYEQKLRTGHYLMKTTIEKVDIESASRAVVLTKGLMSPTQDEKEDYKYILTSQGPEWVIEDIVQVCAICKGTGIATDYEKWSRNGYRDPKPTKECELCAGTGWSSLIRVQ